MVATIDLRSTSDLVSGDLPGLWTYLQQLVGQPFLFLRQSYGDELTLHLGTPREPASPKLRRRIRGSYVLTLRGSIWSILSGAHSELTFTDPFLKLEATHARHLELDVLEKDPPVESGTLVELVRPFVSDTGGGFGLLLAFADQSRLMIRPCSISLSDVEAEEQSEIARCRDRSPIEACSLSEVEAEERPEIADWELFTSYGRYLRVGPGLTWAYLPSGSQEQM